MKNKHFSASFGVAALLATSMAGCGSPPPKDAGPSSSSTTVPPHNPIVFVHGWAGSPSVWDAMRQNFVNAGWSPSLLFAIGLSNPYSGAAGINITHAGEIRDYINNTVLPQTGGRRIDIIAHSMGGLSSMYYVHTLNGATSGTIADVVCLDCGVQGSTDPLILAVIPDFRQSTEVVTAVDTYDQTPAGAHPDPDDTPHVAGNMTYTFFWHQDSINTLAGSVSQQWPNVAHNDFLTNTDVFNAVKAAVMQNED